MDAYRYTLTRDVGTLLDASPSRLLWIMLNPSTATDETNDPTIRRVIGFTRSAGYQVLEVVNLFGARATSPKALLDLPPECRAGARNAEHMKAAMQHADGVVFAWGAWWENQPARRRGVRIMPELMLPAQRPDLEPMCLGTTVLGHPRHPLYVKADQPLVRYWGEAR